MRKYTFCTGRRDYARSQNYFFIIAFAMEKAHIFICTTTILPGIRYVANVLANRLCMVVTVVTPDQLPADVFTIGYGISGKDLFIPQTKFGDLQVLDRNSKMLQNIDNKHFTGNVWSLDILSFIFLMLTRAEEYRCPTSDEHGRFPSNLHKSVRNHYVHLPWVDIWIFQLSVQLRNYGLQVKMPEYEREITIDIDNPTAYLYKGWKRSLAGMARDTLHFRARSVAKRLLVLSGLSTDPYDHFNDIFEWATRNNELLRFFFWMGDYGPHDKGIAWNHRFLLHWIQKMKSRHFIGIHPSYASFEQSDRLGKEKKRLEGITEAPITASRQHFLRMKLPDTYIELIENGIQSDYSMGFGEIFGFRAGTSRSFHWFNVETDTETTLEVHPFALMDSSAYYKLKLSPVEFYQSICQYEQMLKPIGGKLTLILHNELAPEILSYLNK